MRLLLLCNAIQAGYTAVLYLLDVEPKITSPYFFPFCVYRTYTCFPSLADRESRMGSGGLFDDLEVLVMESSGGSAIRQRLAVIKATTTGKRSRGLILAMGIALAVTILLIVELSKKSGDGARGQERRGKASIN